MLISERRRFRRAQRAGRRVRDLRVDRVRADGAQPRGYGTRTLGLPHEACCAPDGLEAEALVERAAPGPRRRRRPTRRRARPRRSAAADQRARRARAARVRRHVELVDLDRVLAPGGQRAKPSGRRRPRTTNARIPRRARIGSWRGGEAPPACGIVVEVRYHSTRSARVSDERDLLDVRVAAGAAARRGASPRGAR